MTDDELAARARRLAERRSRPATAEQSGADRTPPTAARRSKRSHKAEAARVLAAGLSTSAMLGVVTVLATESPATSATSTPPPSITTTTAPPPPTTIYETVIRHHPAPSGATASRPRTSAPAPRASAPVAAPDQGSSAPTPPAPPPVPAPTTPPPPPATSTGGS